MTPKNLSEIPAFAPLRECFDVALQLVHRLHGLSDDELAELDAEIPAPNGRPRIPGFLEELLHQIRSFSQAIARDAADVPPLNRARLEQLMQVVEPETGAFLVDGEPHARTWSAGRVIEQARRELDDLGFTPLPPRLHEAVAARAATHFLQHAATFLSSDLLVPGLQAADFEPLLAPESLRRLVQQADLECRRACGCDERITDVDTALLIACAASTRTPRNGCMLQAREELAALGCSAPGPILLRLQLGLYALQDARALLPAIAPAVTRLLVLLRRTRQQLLHGSSPPPRAKGEVIELPPIRKAS